MLSSMSVFFYPGGLRDHLSWNEAVTLSHSTTNELGTFLLLWSLEFDMIALEEDRRLCTLVKKEKSYN